jgi:transposase
MKDKLVMSKKERDRKVILEFLREGKFSLKEAAERMKVSYRHAKRIKKRYLLSGDAGLIHASRGKYSSRSFSGDFRGSVLKRYQERYLGFGPTFASEKLEEDGLLVNHETLRGWLKAEGLWAKKRKRSKYRSRRTPRSRFGEMVQMDGSPHRWFGPDGPQTCLMHLVDDATKTSLAIMSKEETTEAAFCVLQKWIKRYGVPKSLYVDLKTVYVSPLALKSKSDEDITKQAEAQTHFSRACEKLGIKIIKAYSPQAKGRVERKHAIYQDRLVKEIALNDFKTIDEVNLFLKKKFVSTINKKFTIAPANQEDAHRSKQPYNLNQIFCWEYTRMLQQDWTISFEATRYQIKKTYGLAIKPRAKITVKRLLNQTLHLSYKGTKLQFKQIETSQLNKPEIALNKVKFRRALVGEVIEKQNKQQHPWRQFNSDWSDKKQKLAQLRVA